VTELPEHLRALLGLKKARVDFLIIGAAAIDLFMPEMGYVYNTADCDILVRPELQHLQRALAELAREGYHFTVNGQPLLEATIMASRLLEYRGTIRAQRKDSMPIDVMVEAIGFSFEEWWSRRRTFKAGGAALPCAALEHVFESKRLSGRPKDEVLLELVAASHGPALRRSRAHPHRRAQRRPRRGARLPS